MSEQFDIDNGVLQRYHLREEVVEIPLGIHTIADGAFKGCASIKKIVMPDSVRVIEKDAFKGCKHLEEIYISKNLQFLGGYAFYRCHSLKEVSLPSTVTKVDNCTFLYCDSLEKVYMPGVTSFGRQAFLYDIALKELQISAQIKDGLHDVFTGCNKITRIKIVGQADFYAENMLDVLQERVAAPDIVRSIVEDIYKSLVIKNNVLLQCNNNTRKLEVPEGIVGIGKSCFFDKRGIASVRFPKSLAKVDSKAFRNCINLQEVFFASNEVQVEKDAFNNCSSLSKVYLNDVCYEFQGLADLANDCIPSLVYDVFNQVLSNFSLSGTTLMEYIGSESRVVVPYGVTHIGEYAFKGKEMIDRVVLPESVSHIAKGAFEGCVVMQTVQLSNNIETIAPEAFKGCVKLLVVDLPDKLRTIDNGVFNRCEKLKEVKNMANIEKIEDFAFYGCKSLSVIDFSFGLQKIGVLAFYKCASLQDVRFPTSLRYLLAEAFAKSGVVSVAVNAGLVKVGSHVFAFCPRLKSISFADGSEKIGDFFAYDCKKLVSVSMPQSLKEIGKAPFAQTPFWQSLEKGVFADYLFDGSDYEGAVVVPDNIRIVAGNAFYGNEKVTSIALNDELVSIGASAFVGCTKLVKIVLPEGIDKINAGVFSCCEHLQEVTSIGTIRYIGDEAFYNCGLLEKAPIEKAAYIGNNALERCSSLRHGVFVAKFIGRDAFAQTKVLDDNKKADGSVIINDILVDGLETSGEVVIDDSVESISPYAFFNNRLVTKVILPNTLKSIGEYAFAGCKNLVEVIFNDEIDFVGQYAFSKCTALNSADVKAGQIEKGAFAYCTKLLCARLSLVEVVADFLFAGCKSLEMVDLPNAKVVKKAAFQYCYKLVSFDFAKVNYVGKNAFESCDGLKSIALPAEIVLDSYAFKDCCYVEQITMVGCEFVQDSFSGCTSVKAISLDGSLYEHLDYDAFLERAMPNSIKDVYSSCLSCFQITTDKRLVKYKNTGTMVCIPKGIVSIDEEVFFNTNVVDFSIAKSVKYIGARTFQYTKWLEDKKAKQDLVVVNDILLDATNAKGDVVLPANIKYIAGWAFANALGLRSIKLPVAEKQVKLVQRDIHTNDVPLSVTLCADGNYGFDKGKSFFVEEYAFRNCINLKMVCFADSQYTLSHIADLGKNYPRVVKNIFAEAYNCFKVDEEGYLYESTGNIPDLVFPEGIYGIKDGVFTHSNLLTTVTLTKDVKSIGAMAFSDCAWLKSVFAAQSVTKIGKRAFSNCTALEMVELSNELQNIGERAFEHCTNLQTIILPEGLECIPAKAFFRCKSLQKIVLPTTVKIIEQEAFAFCSSLEEVKFLSSTLTIKSRAFAFCEKLKLEDLPLDVEFADDALFGVENEI